MIHSHFYKTRASCIIPLHDQKQEWLLRIRMVDNSKLFLYTSTYFMSCDNYGREYIEALLKARKRGVEILFLIDSFGQMLSSNLLTECEKKETKQSWAKLTESGVKLIFYRCSSRLKRWLGSGIHIKIQLSDQGESLFASGNISSSSYERWREFTAYVKGDIVANLLEEFTRMGASINNAHLQHLQNISKDIPQEPLTYLSYNPEKDPHWLNPLYLKNPNPITDHLLHAFQQAKHHISLTSFYFKPFPSLTKALIQAARNGVVVEIFHSHRDALGPTIIPWIPSWHLYKELLQAGVRIYENKTGEHSKIILIDQKSVIFGSYNLEYASHNRVAESMIQSQNPQLIQNIKNSFNQLRYLPENSLIDYSILKLQRNIFWKVWLYKPLSKWVQKHLILSNRFS